MRWDCEWKYSSLVCDFVPLKVHAQSSQRVWKTPASENLPLKTLALRVPNTPASAAERGKPISNFNESPTTLTIAFACCHLEMTGVCHLPSSRHEWISSRLPIPKHTLHKSHLANGRELANYSVDVSGWARGQSLHLPADIDDRAHKAT